MKFNPAPLISSMTGALGKSAVMAVRNHQQTMRTVPTTNERKTELKKYVQKCVETAAKKWKSTTPAMRKSWEDFAYANQIRAQKRTNSETKISGYQLFVRSALMRIFRDNNFGFATSAPSVLRTSSAFALNELAPFGTDFFGCAVRLSQTIQATGFTIIPRVQWLKSRACKPDIKQATMIWNKITNRIYTESVPVGTVEFAVMGNVSTYNTPNLYLGRPYAMFCELVTGSNGISYGTQTITSTIR